MYTHTGSDWDCQVQGSAAFIVNGAPPVCVSADCNAVNGNINGEILKLDINSWEYSAGPNKPPKVTSAAECCDQCRSMAGCNAWTFCWKEGGCGSGKF
jgi:hypothetical protein